MGRLDAGEVIIGDGGMIFELEKRCYATGDYTPECVIEYPDAGRPCISWSVKLLGYDNDNKHNPIITSC